MKGPRAHLGRFGHLEEGIYRLCAGVMIYLWRLWGAALFMDAGTQRVSVALLLFLNTLARGSFE